MRRMCQLWMHVLLVHLGRAPLDPELAQLLACSYGLAAFDHLFLW